MSIKSPNFIILLCLIVISLSSCSFEKRLYRPGFHVEWSQNIHKSGVDNKDSTYNRNRLNQTLTEDPDFSEYEKTNAGFNETASASNEKDLIEVNSQFSSNTSYKINSSPTEKSSTESAHSSEIKSKLISDDNRALKKAYRKIQKANSKLSSTSNDGQGSAGLRAIGWVILILGILILLFASILIGGFLMLLGLIFVTAGAKKGSERRGGDEKSDLNYIDVVYLKNGGLVRGMIIEQMPNVQLKIQTRDGNVFVYKMDEIEKIAKELEKK